MTNFWAVVKQAQSVGAPIGEVKADGSGTTITFGVSGAFRNNVGGAAVVMAVVGAGMLLL